MQHRNERRRAWIEISRDALLNNVQVLQGLLPSNCKLMPAVKSNGYGLGAVEISRALNDFGIRSFCVATLDEGIELRKNGIIGEILVLGYTDVDGAADISYYGLSQTAVDAAYAKKLATKSHSLATHIKIDTGMHRLGERADRLDEIKGLFTLEGLNIKGIYTKLCCCDSTCPVDIQYTENQLQSFNHVVSELYHHGFNPAPHALCSYVFSTTRSIHTPMFGREWPFMDLSMKRIVWKNHLHWPLFSRSKPVLH